MTYPLERYLNGRSAMDGSFRPDGRRPAFLTDITGTYQVWAVDVPPPGHRASSPEQLAIFRERVLSVTYSPVADEKIFSTMAIYSLSSSRYPMVPCSLSRACRGVAARRGVRRPREGPRVAGTHLADKPRAPY
jgi:hypothetical protein